MNYKDFTEPIKAGFNNSNIGIAFNKSIPALDEYEKLSPFKKAMAQAANMASDIPVYSLGAGIGGLFGAVGALVGALALQKSHRQYLNELYGGNNDRNNDLLSGGARVAQEGLYGAAEGLTTAKAAQLLGKYAPLILNKIANKRAPTVNINNDMLNEIKNKYGQNSDFYNFVLNNRKYIEKRQIVNEEPIDFIKKNLRLNAENKAMPIQTPIEEIKLNRSNFAHLLNHPIDKSRGNFIPESINTLKRPNEIIEKPDGEKLYFKLFYDETNEPIIANRVKTHMNVTGKDNGRGYQKSSYRVHPNRYIKEKDLGSEIYSAPRLHKTWTTPRPSVVSVTNKVLKVNEKLKKLLGSFYDGD